MKTFKDEFDKILNKLKNKENFAFSRFSDGELFIMQNKTIILAKDHYVTGRIKGPNIYTEEEQKQFIPEKHQFYRQKVIECFKHKQHNYFFPFPKCCLSDKAKRFQFFFRGDQGGVFTGELMLFW